MIVAHFSDVHALALDGVPAWQWASKRLAGYLNLRLNRREKHRVQLFEALVEDLNRNPADQVIVTGDLTNLSLAPELALARSILDRLALGPNNVTVVPGNHDVYTLDALWSRSFHKMFAPYFHSDDGGADFPVVRVRGELAIFGLSTAFPSPPPLADGWIGRAQLAALETALGAHAGKFRVLALHHPPVKNRASILRGLRDRGALQRVLARSGCELVIHGHEHRDLRVTMEGPSGAIPVIGVGSGSYEDDRQERRARYNVYTVENGRLVNVQTRVHDRASG
ncbi:MAG TPA: metallophosphoesterase, partial [Polyangia bacterium]